MHQEHFECPPPILSFQQLKICISVAFLVAGCQRVIWENVLEQGKNKSRWFLNVLKSLNVYIFNPLDLNLNKFHMIYTLTYINN